MLEMLNRESVFFPMTLKPNQTYSREETQSGKTSSGKETRRYLDYDWSYRVTESEYRLKSRRAQAFN